MNSTFTPHAPSLSTLAFSCLSRSVCPPPSPHTSVSVLCLSHSLFLSLPHSLRLSSLPSSLPPHSLRLGSLSLSLSLSVFWLFLFVFVFVFLTMFGFFVFYFWNTHTDEVWYRHLPFTSSKQCRGRPFQTLISVEEKSHNPSDAAGHNVILRFTIC